MSFTTEQYRYLLSLVMDELTTMRDARDSLMTERKQIEQRIQSYRRARDEAEQIAKAYLSELELTAEEVGAESPAQIRETIRVLQDRAERAERAEADNAALFQAAWDVVWAPVTTGHADLASKTYWARRRKLTDLLNERMNGGYPGRQLLVEREKLMEQIEKLTTTTGEAIPARP